MEEALKRIGFTLSKLVDEKTTIAEIMEKRQFLSIDEVYAAIGYGGMSASILVNKFASHEKQIKNEEKRRTSVSKVESHGDEGILIDGHGDLLKNLARCCNPIPGDDIVGYVSKGRGIIVHRCDCENIDKLDSSRFIETRWNISEDDNFHFLSTIDVYAKNKNNVYIEVTNAMSELGIKVASLNSAQGKNDELVLRITVEIKNKTQLQQAKNKLASLALIYEVV